MINPSEIAKITATTADNYTNRAESFSAWADEQDAAAAVARKRLLAVAQSPLHALLDIGCGNGRDSVAFARSGVTRIVGVDPCAALLGIARRNAPPTCSFHLGDIVEPATRWQPPLDANVKFNAFFALASLFHVPKSLLPITLSNISTMSAPNSLLLSSFPRGNSDRPMSDGRWCTELSNDEHNELLRIAGFDPIEQFEVNIYNGKWDVIISRKTN